MKVIHKEKILLDRRHHTYNLPDNTRIIDFQPDPNESDVFWFWYVRDASYDSENTDYTLTIVGTGWDFPDNYEHLKTVHEDSYVWHLLEVLDESP